MLFPCIHVPQTSSLLTDLNLQYSLVINSATQIACVPFIGIYETCKHLLELRRLSSQCVLPEVGVQVVG